MGKLHDRMQEDLLLKAYSPHTQRSLPALRPPFRQPLHEVSRGDGGAGDSRLPPPSGPGS